MERKVTGATPPTPEILRSQAGDPDESEVRVTPDELKEWMRKSHISQSELARRLGVEHATVWRWLQPAGSRHHSDMPLYLGRALGIEPTVRDELVAERAAKRKPRSAR